VNPRRILYLTGAMLFLVHAGLMANPSGGSVAAGSASIAGQGTSTVTINQLSNTAIINWQTFSIGAGELTKFVQPTSTSAVLNRVLGGQTSLIDGTLSANGQVYLINGNGIVVGPGGVVSSNAFTASTRDIADTDFLAGNLHFTGNSSAGVQNLGRISALGGNVVLIGQTVDNEGKITAPGGTVGLVAGNDVLLAQKNADGSTITVSPTSVTSGAAGKVGVHNGGTIASASAELKAANGNIYALAVQNEGTIRATTVQKQGGRIWLTSDSGAVSNSGTLDASATTAGGKGGTVALKSATGTASHTGRIIAQGGLGGAGGNAEISGATLQFTGLVDLTAPGGSTGNLRLDPLTLTIQNGGSTIDLTASIIDPSAVDYALGTANVTLDADAAIIINSGLSWSGTSVLTLQTNQPGSAITIASGIMAPNGGLILSAAEADDSISASGAINVARFILQNGSWVQNGMSLPAFTAAHDFEIQGGTFLRVAGGNGAVNPYVITDIYGLQGIASPSGHLLGASFALANNVDASTTATWNNGAGFVPIGNGTTSFSGDFNGDNHVIDGLFINTPAASYVGLFGATSTTATVENLGLTNISVSGSVYVGGLEGLNFGTVENSYSTGSVTGSYGSEIVGGLVGLNASVVNNAYSQATVSGTYSVGGLVGSNIGTITNAYYSTGQVNGYQDVGGLVGDNGGTISSSYNSGIAEGNRQVGGLAGDNRNRITDSYNLGTVVGDFALGGLIGDNEGFVSNSYSSGVVGDEGGDGDEAGGLIGFNAGGVQNCFWDIQTSGTSQGFGFGATSGLTGETTAQMLQQSTYANAGWNIGTDLSSNTWVIFDGQTRPMLAMEYSTTIINPHQLQLIGLNSTTLAAHYTVGEDIVLDQGQNNDLEPIVVALPSEIWGTSYGSGAGFVPIGTESAPFTGTFDGLGHTIEGLYIERPNAADVALFGYLASSSEVENIGVTDFLGTGRYEVGGLAGNNNGGTISNSYSTGEIVEGDQNFSLGGLVGDNDGLITHSYSTVSITGGEVYIGGLAGSSGGIVTYSYSTGAVLPSANGGGSGGLIGENFGTISYSYSTGAVGGISSVGGLAGVNTDLISNSYCTGTVTGGPESDNIGGLVGYQQQGTVEACYSASAVSGLRGVAGLVAENNGGTIETSYWATDAGPQNSLLGTVGSNFGTIDSFSSGLTLAQMRLQNTLGPAGTGLSDWDFTLGTGVWGVNGYTSTGLINSGLPYFQWQYPTQALVTPSSQILLYSGTTGSLNQSAYATTFAPGYSSLSALLTGAPALSVVGTNVDVVNTGSPNTVAVNVVPKAGYTIEVADGSAPVIYRPATLIYVADQVISQPGAIDPNFTGRVTGFVDGQDQASATSGTLQFTSPATTASPVGRYAIDGSGLTANNGDYIFIQSPFNSTALTIEIPIPINPPGNPSITVNQAGSFFTSVSNFNAQFNANAGYDALFTQSWFSLFDATQEGGLVSVFAPENGLPRVYSLHGSHVTKQGKTPGGVIAFGSSFTVDGPTGRP